MPNQKLWISTPETLAELVWCEKKIAVQPLDYVCRLKLSTCCPERCTNSTTSLKETLIFGVRDNRRRCPVKILCHKTQATFSISQLCLYKTSKLFWDQQNHPFNINMYVCLMMEDNCCCCRLFIERRQECVECKHLMLNLQYSVLSVPLVGSQPVESVLINVGIYMLWYILTSVILHC